LHARVPFANMISLFGATLGSAASISSRISDIEFASRRASQKYADIGHPKKSETEKEMKNTK